MGVQRGRRFGRSILDARGVVVVCASSSQKEGIEGHEPIPSSSILDDWDPDPPHGLTRGDPWSLHSQPASILAKVTLFEEGGIEKTDYIITRHDK